VKAVIGSLLGSLFLKRWHAASKRDESDAGAWHRRRGVYDGPVLGAATWALAKCLSSILSPAGHFWTSIRLRKGVLPGAVQGRAKAG